MFGGVGLYSGESFFALIDDDVLFFKVDDANREDYVSRGMKAFMPFPGQPSLGYFQVPAEVIEEAEELTRWARRSVEVAQRAALKKQKQAPARKAAQQSSAKAQESRPQKVMRRDAQTTCRRCTQPRAGAVASGFSGKKLSCVGAAAASAATFCRIPCMTLITSCQSEASTSGS